MISKAEVTPSCKKTIHSNIFQSFTDVRSWYVPYFINCLCILVLYFQQPIKKSLHVAVKDCTSDISFNLFYEIDSSTDTSYKQILCFLKPQFLQNTIKH